MPNVASGVAIVGGVVHFGVIQRGLHDCGGEYDLVLLRRVTAVDGLRSKGPFVTVNSSADLVEITMCFEDNAVTDVAQKVMRNDLDRAVVAPAVRITDLVAN